MATDAKWGVADAAQYIAVPRLSDDKYRRGVLGIITGSAQYPGAAVLGVEAALRTGVGMVRYLGPRRAEDLILQRRPEAVMSAGRVQAWLIGSGMDFADREAAAHERITEALTQIVPLVLDGGALDVATHAEGPVVITPHFRELARLLAEPVENISAEPKKWAIEAAQRFGITVLMKGNTTYVTDGETTVAVDSAPPWLATAGAGDALGGILGALVATQSERVLAEPRLLVGIAATASYIHGAAAQRASAGGPVTILDVCAHVPAVVAHLVADSTAVSDPA